MTTMDISKAPPDPHDVQMDTEELDTTARKRAETIMGFEICVLEATGDVFDPSSGWQQPRFAKNLGEASSDEDDVPPEVSL